MGEKDYRHYKTSTY